MRAFIRLSCLLFASVCLKGCAPMLAVVGYSGSAVQLVAQAERIKLVGDGVSYVGSGKTITDHALSMVAGADCRIFNVVSRDPVCASKTAGAAADSKVRLSLGPATEHLPHSEARADFELDAENTAPAPAPAASLESVSGEP
jgi:hypothetical protein